MLKHSNIKWNDLQSHQPVGLPSKTTVNSSLMENPKSCIWESQRILVELIVAFAESFISDSSKFWIRFAYAYAGWIFYYYVQVQKHTRIEKVKLLISMHGAAICKLLFMLGILSLNEIIIIFLPLFWRKLYFSSDFVQ